MIPYLSLSELETDECPGVAEAFRTEELEVMSSSSVRVTDETKRCLSTRDEQPPRCPLCHLGDEEQAQPSVLRGSSLTRPKRSGDVRPERTVEGCFGVEIAVMSAKGRRDSDARIGDCDLDCR